MDAPANRLIIPAHFAFVILSTATKATLPGRETGEVQPVDVEELPGPVAVARRERREEEDGAEDGRDRRRVRGRADTGR